MTADIAKYWRAYEELTDRRRDDRENLAVAREVVDGMRNLAAAAEQESDLSEAEHQQLEAWIHTFFRYCAELSLFVLSLSDDAVHDYRRSLEHFPDLEAHVGLIQALCAQGAFDEAGLELNRLRDCGHSFARSGDADSALKVMRLLCTHAALVQTVDAPVLRDMLLALCHWGVNLSLVPIDERRANP
jgi:hypothetical protein